MNGDIGTVKFSVCWIGCHCPNLLSHNIETFRIITANKHLFPLFLIAVILVKRPINYMFYRELLVVFINIKTFRINQISDQF